MCIGGDNGGFSLFVEDDRLRYHYNWFTLERYDVISESALPRGQVVLGMEFTCDTTERPGSPATVHLSCNGIVVGRGRVDKQVAGFNESLDVGHDSMSPVYPGYRDRLPFRFTGTIERVDFQFGGGAPISTAELIEEHLRSD